MQTSPPESAGLPPNGDTLLTDHPRSFAENRYVYPVLSRRAGGISIGVNLSLGKWCNFRCVYCQVDRAAVSSGDPAEVAKTSPIDLPRLAAELDHAVELVLSGRLFQSGLFGAAPAGLRRLNDIALSGDGEPTASGDFEEVVNVLAEVRARRRLDDVKLVLITNASLLHLDRVQRALRVLDANHGEIWAKLDAGSEDYYRQIARTAVPLARILDNLRQTSLVRPIVIQSLFARLHETPPPAAEIAAYCRRLSELAAAGGQIKLVQIHTVARATAESWVAPLTNAEVDALAETGRRTTGLPVAAFYGH